MLKLKFFLPVFLVICCYAYSQNDIASHPPYNKYTAIDSYVKTVKYKNNLEVLSSELTKNYNSDLDKARAIFVWITDNVAYDYKFVNRNKKNRIPKM